MEESCDCRLMMMMMWWDCSLALDNIYPNGKQRHREEVVEQDERLTDDACQKADGPVDALPAALEIAETPALEGFQLRVCNFQVFWSAGFEYDIGVQEKDCGRGLNRTVCGEESVQRLREDVDDARQGLAAPVETAHLLQHRLCVV